MAYLGDYKKAIKIFSEGIEKFPEDARMYRHRGHRYISLRKLDLAIADLEKAAELIDGKEDRVEPDGIPNARGIPVSTTNRNIWYHLWLYPIPFTLDHCGNYRNMKHWSYSASAPELLNPTSV